MKRIMRQMLLTLLVVMMAASIALPAAMALEEKPVANGTPSVSLYAGMKDTLQVTRNGVTQSNTKYKWKSSKSSVVSVTQKGVITAKKAGSATITATRKSDGGKCSIKVKVKRNKVDKINSKPAASAAPYKSAAIALKSVEIVSPTKVVVEYYVVCNYPSSWKASRIESISDAINLHNRYTGALEKTIVGGYYQVTSKKVSGFKARKGKSVQVVKVTYSGSQVDCANIKLSDYKVSNSTNVSGKIWIYK